MATAENLSHLRGFDSFELKLGDELRGERATLGKSLLDVQRELRIKAAYIAAIENCDVAVFPNQGFIAGYVRSYARYLDMDPEAVFARFCDESGFGGVNAGLTAEKKSSGRIVASGPVRVDKDDPLLRPLRPSSDYQPGFMDRVSISAIGSLVVVLMMIGGLGFGGYSVVQNIQRVQITPVDQRPEAFAQVDEIGNPTNGLDESPLTYPDADGLQSNDLDLSRLYKPRELDVPVLDRRDGPILDIDPSRAGLLAQPAEPSAGSEDVDFARLDGIAAAELMADELGSVPQVREEVSVPVVNVVARQPAWVRVYLADGSILFEKILQTGESYKLPSDVEAPLLRAGNAGSVYLAVNDTVYGPIGSGTSVAKGVSLIPTDISTAHLVVDELPDEFQAMMSALNTQ